MMLCMSWYKNATVPKIYVSEGIDVNKTSASKKCKLCHYLVFKDVGFKFEEHFYRLVNNGLFFKKYSNTERKRCHS